MSSVSLPDLEVLLANFERRAADSKQPDQKARAYNLAGDMCIDAQQPERALSYYDQAINTFTASENYEAAAKVCEKILVFKPDAVRPYYTLACLALKKGGTEHARKRILQYADAAEKQKLARISRTYLLNLAEITDEPEVLDAIASALRKLGDAANADGVLGRIGTRSA